MSQMNQHLLAESELNLETIDLQQRAYTGDAEAQYAHVQKNTNHAFYWYQSAAHQGNLLAQYNVWFAYLTGEGIQANTQQANKWFARASLKNSRSTQSIVAQLLDTTIH